MGLLMSPAARWLAGLLLVLAAFFGGYLKGGKDERAEIVEETIEATREARKLERQSQARQQEILNERDAEIRRIRARLNDALERLRKRPDRLPEASRAACQGATGAELSGRDAAFLERLAARADELREELRACQAREHGEVTD